MPDLPKRDEKLKPIDRKTRKLFDLIFAHAGLDEIDLAEGNRRIVLYANAVHVRPIHRLKWKPVFRVVFDGVSVFECDYSKVEPPQDDKPRYWFYYDCSLRRALGKSRGLWEVSIEGCNMPDSGPDIRLVCQTLEITELPTPIVNYAKEVKYRNGGNRFIRQSIATILARKFGSIRARGSHRKPSAARRRQK